MRQILDDFNLNTVKSLFNVGSNYMMTNLSLADVIWFAPKMTNIKPEDIRFHTVPSVWVSAGGYNHNIVYKQETMAIINKYYNMYKEDIPESSFNIFDDGLRYASGRPNYTIYDIDGITSDNLNE